MSSHREAPAISKDPVADNTDTYAFVSPDDPSTVTIISNYLPLEPPFGGPNFYEFGDDVRYNIYIDNDGDGRPDVTYSFDFEDRGRRSKHVPVQHRSDHQDRQSELESPPVLFGDAQDQRGRARAGHPPAVPAVQHRTERRRPNYATLASEAIHSLPGGRTVFAGQRLEGFYVDLGAIFDLGDLRPFEKYHILGSMSSVGVNSTNNFGVHSIAIKVPVKQDLTANGSVPSDPSKPGAVVGVWAAASRRKTFIREPGGGSFAAGGWVQVSRLGNPLINEVIIPMGRRIRANSLTPADDHLFLGSYQHPELAG